MIREFGSNRADVDQVEKNHPVRSRFDGDPFMGALRRNVDSVRPGRGQIVSSARSGTGRL
jgi:hypothetical protein